MNSLSQPPSLPFVRAARPADVPDIHRLIESMTADGTLLRRSLSEISSQIGSFVIANSAEGEFLGCAALYRYGSHLAEIRSIAVREQARGLGAGGMLLKRLLDEIESSGTQCACLFTRVPEFFAHYGFQAVRLAAFADKIRKDCVRCPRRQGCDEVAMAFGKLPPLEETAMLPLVQQLVRLH